MHCRADAPRSNPTEFFFLKNWRDFYEQKFQETEKFNENKSEMSCESHWEESVSLADGNKWRPFVCETVLHVLKQPWHEIYQNSNSLNCHKIEQNIEITAQKNKRRNKLHSK